MDPPARVTLGLPVMLEVIYVNVSVVSILLESPAESPLDVERTGWMLSAMAAGHHEARVRLTGLTLGYVFW